MVPLEEIKVDLLPEQYSRSRFFFSFMAIYQCLYIMYFFPLKTHLYSKYMVIYYSYKYKNVYNIYVLIRKNR